MNDQTSPTAGGQGPGSAPWRDPFQEPRDAQGLPGVPRFGEPAGGRRARLRAQLAVWRPDLVAAVALLAVGTALGVAAGLLWYRFAPTVWLAIPADAVSQVKSNVDQSSLLVAPESKGIASVDGYYFVFTAVAGLLLGALGFWLGRRGYFGGRDSAGQRDGAGVGAWAGVLLGALAASTLAAALGRWVSLPDPMTVLHAIAAGHPFHAPVALHARGLYLAGPALGSVLFLALTAAFTKPAPMPWQGQGPEQRSQMFFSSDDPYGLAGAGAGADGGRGNGLGPAGDAGAAANGKGAGADAAAEAGDSAATSGSSGNSGSNSDNSRDNSGSGDNGEASSGSGTSAQQQAGPVS